MTIAERHATNAIMVIVIKECSARLGSWDFVGLCYGLSAVEQQLDSVSKTPIQSNDSNQTVETDS